MTLLGLAFAVVAAAPNDRIANGLDALKQAPTEQQAAVIEGQIMAAWQAQLTPAVQLLVERAGDEVLHGKPKDAAADLDAAVELQPESADLWRRRAEAHFAFGDDQAAVADIAQALSREPRCFPALSDLSRFSEARENFRRALNAWQKLLEIDPKVGQGQSRLLRLQHKVMGQPA